MTDAGTTDARAEEKREPGAQRNSVLEYIVAAVGLLLVVTAAGFLAYEAFTAGDAPPDIRLEVVRVVRSSGGYLVTLAARNLGDETAAELAVEGSVERPGQPSETSDVTFDYLPPDSEREGGLLFTQDPRGALTLRVLGYREP